MTLIVLSIAVLGLIVAFSTSLSASVVHRSLATNDVALRSAAETALYDLQQQQPSPYVACASEITAPSGYQPSSNNNFGISSSTYSVAIAVVGYWDSTNLTFDTSLTTCQNNDLYQPNAPELINLTVTNTTNNTVVSTEFAIDGRSK